MTSTTEIWKLAQRLEPQLWARLADGSLPENVVDDIISDRLETAEKCIILRERLMDHCVTVAVEAAVNVLARDLTFGEGGYVSPDAFGTTPRIMECDYVISREQAQRHAEFLNDINLRGKSGEFTPSENSIYIDKSIN